MKNYLVLALAVVAMASCKKEPYAPTGITPDSDEILFSTSTSTKGLAVDYDDANHKGNFVADDVIGVFVANDNQTQPLGAIGYDWTLDGTRLNVPYEFAEPFWKPLVLADRLKFAPIVADKATTGSTKLYAYFPHSDASKYSFTPETFAVTYTKVGDAPELKYTLPLEQSNSADLRVADLMFAMSVGDGVATEGWKPTSKAINLAFSHLLTKLSFEIKLENKANPGANKEITRYVRAVEVASVGVDAVANPADGDIIVKPGIEFDEATGDFVVDGTETTGSVWASYLAENAGIEIKTDANGATAQVGDPLADIAAKLDMLLIPFIQTADANKFYIYLSTDNTAITDKVALAAAVKAGTVEKYTVNIPAAEAATGADGAFADSDKWNFEKGRANKFALTIDPGNKTINITTSVTPWTANTVHTPEID